MHGDMQGTLTASSMLSLARSNAVPDSEGSRVMTGWGSERERSGKQAARAAGQTVTSRMT